MNELGTQLVDEGHPSANEIQKTTENVNSRLVLFQILFGSFFFSIKETKVHQNCFVFCRWVELQDGLDARKKELNDAIRLQKFYVETTETKVSFRC